MYGVEGVNEAGRAAGIAGDEWARPRGHERSAGLDRVVVDMLGSTYRMVLSEPKMLMS